MHVRLHVVTGRHTAARRIFWKILSVQCCASRRRKPRLTLARRGCASRQLHLTLLLPDGTEAIFVDEPALAAARDVSVVPPALLPRATVAVLAAAVLFLG